MKESTHMNQSTLANIHQVIPFRCLWDLAGPEADQVRLVLRLRAGRGGLVNFDRREAAHAASEVAR